MKRILLAALLVLPFAVSPAQAQREVRIAAFTHEKSVVVVHLVQPFIDAVNAEVGDKIKLRGYFGGSLGRDAAKYYDLIKDGIADIAYFDPGYTPGRFPDFGLFEMPFLARNGKEASIAMWRMYKMGMIGGLDELKTLGVFSTDTYHIQSSKPVDSVFDLKGMKVRSAAAVHSDVVKALNGVPIGLSITETTEALSRGVVDGAYTGFSTLTTFRMLPVVKHHYEIPLGVLPLAMGMNKKTWDSLPAEAKAAIDKHSGEVFSVNGGGGFDTVGQAARKQIAGESSHKSYPATDADYAKGAALTKPVLDKWIAETKDGQKKYDTFVRLLAEIRKGG